MSISVALRFLGCAFLLAALSAPGWSADLINVSYDPTREFYEEYNRLFAAHWEAQTGETVNVRQLHGGSMRQARLVMEGLEADVVTLALGSDIDEIAARSGWIAMDWREQFPYESAPYTSAVAFLVRSGNPRGIRDWGDLVQPGLVVVTSNPKTSGGGRWSYVAARIYAMQRFDSDNAKVAEYLAGLYRNTPFLHTSAGDAARAFVERGNGDVLLTWESEALSIAAREDAGAYEVVVPSISILAEPPVAVVDTVAARHGTADVARAYLDYLYSEAGQELAARYFFRPRLDSVVETHRDRFADVALIDIDEYLGGWPALHDQLFAHEGEFDRIFACRHKPSCPADAVSCRRAVARP